MKSILGKDASWPVKALRTTFLASALFLCAPPVIGVLSGSPLQPSDLQSVRNFYRGAIDFHAVRLVESKGSDLYMSYTGSLAKTHGHAVFLKKDLRDMIDHHDPEADYIIAHEFAHILQQERDPFNFLRCAWEKVADLLVGGDGEDLYDYTLESGKPFASYGIEQQASIVADYFNITRGRPPLYLKNSLSTAQRDALYREVLRGFMDWKTGPDVLSSPGDPVA